MFLPKFLTSNNNNNGGGTLDGEGCVYNLKGSGVHDVYLSPDSLRCIP